MKCYGSLTAVDGLSLTVGSGQILALLGPNGAGKSTTIEICEGFRTADAGTVRVLGLDPGRDAARIRPRVGVMLQGGGAYPGAKAGEMLRLVAAYCAHPIDPSLLLERLGLRSVERTNYRRLSGGQQQRLSLAMAVVGRPELVFLDEPTAGLDPQARRATWDLVGALAADGVAIVLTTHYMEEAERLAGHIVVIDHGRAVASGSPAELTRAQDSGEVRLRTESPLNPTDLTAALPAGSRVRIEDASDGREPVYVVTGLVDPPLVAAVVSHCARVGVLVADLQVTRRTLEDVFLELTGRELRA